MDSQKLMDDARKICEFVPNPQAEEFVPKNATNTIPIKPRFVYIKTPLVVYQKKEKEGAKLDLTRYGYEEYLPEFSGAMDLTGHEEYLPEFSLVMDLTGYEEYLPEYSAASFDSTNWPEMDLTGYKECLPGYSGTSFDNAYWLEGVTQRDLTGSGYQKHLSEYSGTSSNTLYWPEEVGQYKQSGKA